MTAAAEPLAGSCAAMVRAEAKSAFTAAAAEANRTPFDLPEAESEIIAGYFTEYSGFKFAIFFLAEYLGLFAMCGLGITLFLGGWLPPFKFLGFIPSWCWFLGKLVALILLFIWLRGTLPRYRYDQLMDLGWKRLIPTALLWLLVIAAMRIGRAPASRAYAVAPADDADSATVRSASRTAPTPRAFSTVANCPAKLRSFRPPEPYKGKGVKYEGEYIRRKAGKAAATAGAKGA